MPDATHENPRYDKSISFEWDWLCKAWRLQVQSRGIAVDLWLDDAEIAKVDDALQRAKAVSRDT